MTNAIDTALDFEIVPISQVPLREVLRLLNQTFGTDHDELWFNWKHIDNPFGKSLGWVAQGDGGILGVRLFMSWTLQANGKLIRAVRPVDTATAPHARRRGVFRELTRFAVDAITANSQVHLIFNTPNVNSRPGYQQMGWSILPPIAHGIRFVLPGPHAGIERSEATFNAFDDFRSELGKLTTYRSTEIMRWRYDHRSGVCYKIASLRQSQAANGIVYRTVTRRGIPLLVINELAGSTKERRLLVRSAARHEGALAVLMATGAGALELMPGFRIQRGNSVLAVRALRSCQPEPTRLDSWGLTLGDLEMTI